MKLREKLAKERMIKLIRMAFSVENRELARRYVELARLIGIRNRVRVPREFRRNICKMCDFPLIPGRTATIRVEKGIISVKCLHCGAVRRFPFKPYK